MKPLTFASLLYLAYNKYAFTAVCHIYIHMFLDSLLVIYWLLLPFPPVVLVDFSVLKYNGFINKYLLSVLLEFLFSLFLQMKGAAALVPCLC